MRLLNLKLFVATTFLIWSITSCSEYRQINNFQGIYKTTHLYVPNEYDTIQDNISEFIASSYYCDTIIFYYDWKFYGSNILMESCNSSTIYRVDSYYYSFPGASWKLKKNEIQMNTYSFHEPDTTFDVIRSSLIWEIKKKRKNELILYNYYLQVEWHLIKLDSH